MRTAMQPVKILANWSSNVGRVKQQLSTGTRQLVRVLCSETLAGKIVAQQQSITRQLNALSSSVSTMNKLLQALPDTADPCALPNCPPGWKITTTTLAGQRLGIGGINFVTECGLRQVSQSPVAGTNYPYQSLLTEDDHSPSEVFGRGRVIRVPDFKRDPGSDASGLSRRIHRGADHTFVASDDPEISIWAKKGETHHTSLMGDVSFNCTGDHVLSGDSNGVFKISGFDSDGKWAVKVKASHSSFCGSGVFNMSGDRCLTFGGDRVVKIWANDVAGNWYVQADIDSSVSIADALFNADGDTVLTYSHEGMVRIFAIDYSGSWYEQAAIYHGHDICSVSFNNQNDHVLICGNDNVARIWGRGEYGHWCEKALVCHTKELKGAIFSTQGDLAVTFSEDGTVVILDCDQHGSWRERGLIEHDSPIEGVIINEHQDCILTFCTRGTVKAWARHYR